MGGPAPTFRQPDDPGVLKNQGHSRPPYTPEEEHHFSPEDAVRRTDWDTYPVEVQSQSQIAKDIDESIITIKTIGGVLLAILMLGIAIYIFIH